MAWPALDPGRLLERCGNAAPRGMAVHDRTRLIGRLPHLRTRACPHALYYAVTIILCEKNMPSPDAEQVANCFRHTSVLLEGGTFGRGGHSRLILDRLDAQGQLLAMDRDPQAIAAAADIDDPRFQIAQREFAQLAEFAREQGVFGKLSGVLLDVGVSSPQLDDPERGFSFMRDGPLDMRMDPTQGQSVADFLARASEADIAYVFKTYGEERYAKRLARAVVTRRVEKPFTHTVDLAEVLKVAHPAWEKGRHPATKAFQGLRIFVNGELEQLDSALDAALEALAPGGHLVVISFHSLEDRRVKRFIRHHVRGDTDLPRGVPIRDDQMNRRLEALGKGVRPSEEEVDANPRARSAVMRAARKRM